MRPPRSYVTYGTPLPNDENDVKPVWKQEVTDEQGRRRFHGAFTGGFSAGYFNTVGSEEGWTPSQYIKDAPRSGNFLDQARAYMDAEDLENFENSRQVKTAKTEKQPMDSLDSWLSFIANDQTGHLNVGYTTLEAMGWKPQQGIGPLVPLVERNAQRKRYGLKGIDPLLASQVKKDILLPPLDAPLVLPLREALGYSRHWGVGYHGSLFENLETLGHRPHFTMVEDPPVSFVHEKEPPKDWVPNPKRSLWNKELETSDASIFDYFKDKRKDAEALEEKRSAPQKSELMNRFTTSHMNSGHVSKPSEKQMAVRENRFGPSTHSKEAWYPDPLLSKRFGETAVERDTAIPDVFSAGPETPQLPEDRSVSSHIYSRIFNPSKEDPKPKKRKKEKPNPHKLSFSLD